MLACFGARSAGERGALQLRIFGFVFSLVAAVLAVWAMARARDPVWPNALEISLRQEGIGEWRLAYALAMPARRLDLGPTVNGFRERDWKVETPGLALATKNGRDYLVSINEGGRFEAVDLKISSHPNSFAKEYEPMTSFDGGAVLYTGHFWPYTEEGSRYDAVFNISAQRGRVSTFGETRDALTDWKSPYRHPAFVYVGVDAAADIDGAHAVVDQSAPQWVKDELKSLTPSLMHELARAFGRELPRAPDLFLAMGDDNDASRIAYSGDALPGQFLITLSGGGWLERNDTALRILDVATAHEAVHLWQEAARPRGDRVPDWIHEGAADAIAAEALVAMRRLSPAEKAEALESARLECGDVLVRQSLRSAETQGSWRASYACGRVLAVIAARARGDASVADFWRDLVARSDEAGGYDEALFIDMIEERAGEEFAAAVARFAYTAFAAPEKELSKLMRRAAALGSRAP